VNNPMYVTAGQIWVPKPESQFVPEVRIVCRYPFHTYDSSSAVWIVESLNRLTLERLPEETLRAYYELQQDVTH
jgi:hypothetical protein